MRVIIIGGGLGGLSSAVTLAKHGIDVHLFEKNDHYGGKMRSVDERGYHFDFGPNTITMPGVFENVIKQGGLDPKVELPFIKLTNHTRNQFKDGTFFDLSTDRNYMKQQLSTLDTKAFKYYDEFLIEIERLYELSNKYFLNRTFDGWKDYFSLSLGRSMAKVRPLQSMEQFFKKYFSNTNILHSLNRYSTYVGSTPYATPATFAMIAHLELNDGVYYVKGGNTKIAESFVKAAQNQGATLQNKTKVTKILTKSKKATGVELENGEQYEADYVIVNGDLLQTLSELVPENHRPSMSDQKIASMDPSISAYVIMAGLNTNLTHLKHHHVLFSSNYQKEFIQLQKGEYAEDPTIYIGTSVKSDPAISRNGDNCFILVNAPALNKKTQVPPEEYKETIYQQIENAGFPIRSHIEMERIVDPADIAKDYGAFKGALYGPSSNKKNQAFLRPFNRSQDLANLYFCGGSTHPGGGSPLVVLSGQNVANQILGKIIDIE